jgi:hypothetical protein
MLVSTLIGFPILIPSIMCFFVRKTPDWAGWGTVLVGMCVSGTIAFGATPENLQALLGLEQPLTSREFTEMKSVTLGLIGHMSITLPFFICSQFFYKGLPEKRAAEVKQFFSNVDTEVVVEDTPQSVAMDNKQNDVLGKMVLIASVFILCLTLVPNPLWGRMLFVIIASILALIGTLLVRSKRSLEVSEKEKPRVSATV